MLLNNTPPLPDWTIARQLLAERVKRQKQMIFVLDDDPTGTQTVHDVPVYTDWEIRSLRDAFREPGPLVYILTNTRGMQRSEATVVIREIATNLCTVSRETNIPFSVILRGDSTLRGHYPLESDLIRQVMEQLTEIRYDGEILIPFFGEGGRLTCQDIHWVESEGRLTPVAQTEFAQDSTFGYHQSDLKLWIEEKTGSRIKADEVVSISLDVIRRGGYRRIADMLSHGRDYQHYVVNAMEYADLYVFALGLLLAEEQGKRFLISSAASFVKVRGSISDRAPLSGHDLLKRDAKGGLVVVGSHVAKTTRQLEQACSLPFVVPIEVSVPRLLRNQREAEIERVTGLCTRAVSEGKTALIFTSREVLRAVQGVSSTNLAISREVSHALVEIVMKLDVTPKFLIAKGGITSSDIGTKALGVKRALAAGQIRPGIPVWLASEDSRFAGLPFIIFPGNVGNDSTLRDILLELAP